MSQTRREVNSGKEQKDTEIDIYPWIEGIIIKTPPKGIDIGFKVPIRKGKIIITAEYSKAMKGHLKEEIEEVGKE